MIKEFDLNEFLEKHNLTENDLSDTEKFLIQKTAEWENVDLGELIDDIDELENYELEEINESIISLKSKKLIHVVKEEFPRVNVTLNYKPQEKPEGVARFKIKW